MATPGIYVESRMKAGVEEIWRRTQEPGQHARWDLRFTGIEYLPRVRSDEPQRFLYSTRIGFGWMIRGEGESVGGREDENGVRTSALKFWSADPKSLIRDGSGYWKYVPVAGGVRFLTRYDYRTRFGIGGSLIDRWVFRPLLGWATAWSFDRLRLWVERGVSPELSMERSIVHSVARIATALIWIYEGLVPKWLRPDTGEIAILQKSLLAAEAEEILKLLGSAEILFGLAFLVFWRSRSLFVANAIVLALLLAGAAPAGASLWAAPFNPLTLTIAMWGLSLVGWMVCRDLPSAANCLREEPEPPR